MARIASLLFLFLALIAGCGPGSERDHKDHDHDHKDHDHKDHGHDHDHDHDHDHSGPNAHLWLDPVLAKQFIEGLAGPLSEALAKAKTDNRKLNIVASIHPVASLLRELTGDDANVFTMLPQGGSPHGFEITPDVMRKLGEADVVIIVGLSLDPWAEKAAKNSGKRGYELLKFSDLVEAHKNGKASGLVGDHPVITRAKSVIDKLDALHAKYQSALAAVKTKELITFHNAFDLLAARYGLKVVAHLTEMDLPTGAEVTPTHLREARDAVKKYQLKTLYAEPAYPDTALLAIAEATGVKVLRLDDLGGEDREGYRTYFEMMESNLKVLMEGQNR